MVSSIPCQMNNRVWPVLRSDSAQCPFFLYMKLKRQLLFYVIHLDNKSIPTGLRKEAVSLHKTLDWEDEGGEGMCIQHGLLTFFFVFFCI